MQSLKILAVAFTTISIMACQPQEKKEAIKTIDYQLNAIEDIIRQYKKLPVDSLQLVLETKLYPIDRKIRLNTAAFQHLDERDMHALFGFIEYTSTLRELIRLADKTVDGIGYAKAQFITLKNDIRNNLIPNDSVRYYVDMEVENFSIVHNDIQKVLQLETLAQQYKDVEQKADSIVTAILGKN